MSARDKVHYQVVNALVKDGWTITHDPLRVLWETRPLQIDLGAERLVAASKDSVKIAVEIKSFLGANDLADLYNALGQFVLYRNALYDADPERTLFLALDEKAYQKSFGTAKGEAMRRRENIKLLVFNQKTEEIVLWKQ